MGVYLRSGFKLLTYILFCIILFYVATNFKQIETILFSKFDQYFTYSTCDRPIYYSIGSVDSRFNLSTPTFRDDTLKAANIWNKVEGKQLLVYQASDSSALKINLVFDSRSALSNQINNLKGQVNQTDQSLESKINDYKQQVADFKNRLSGFYSKADNLNNQIEYWNNKGGVPSDIFQQLTLDQNSLKNEQNSLQNEANNLNLEAKNLNLSTQDYNINVKKLNNTISNFNQALNIKPEEGLFNPNNNTIDIYFNYNQIELIHTIAHEMGHALTLQHNQNPNSIMYPFSTQYITPSNDDISSLNIICSKRYFTIPLLGLNSDIPY